LVFITADIETIIEILIETIEEEEEDEGERVFAKLDETATRRYLEEEERR